jgi:integrase
LQRRREWDILLSAKNQTRLRATRKEVSMSLIKRGRVWQISIRDSNGNRIRRSLKTSNRKKAQRIHDKVAGEVAEGRWFEERPKHSFKEMMDRYLSEHVSQKKSARSYRGYVKNLLAFFGEDILISEITPPLINQFKMKRREDGVKSGTINRDLSILKNCFNIAMKQWEWVDSNPVTRIPMEKEPPGRVRFLTDEEFERLCDACPEWLKPIVLIAKHTGMRKENILSLKWSQVNLFRREITIEDTKNDERLCVPMNDTLMELFKRLAKVRHIKSQYVFFHPDAKKKSAKGTLNGKRYYEVKTSFQEALKKAGIENFRFHDLRHCCASDLVREDVDLYVVQKLLGHKSQAMTQRYAHLAQENLRKAVLRLDNKENEEKILSTFCPHSQKEVSGQGG